MHSSEGGSIGPLSSPSERLTHGAKCIEGITVIYPLKLAISPVHTAPGV